MAPGGGGGAAASAHQGSTYAAHGGGGGRQECLQHTTAHMSGHAARLGRCVNTTTKPSNVWCIAGTHSSMLADDAILTQWVRCVLTGRRIRHGSERRPVGRQLLHKR
jgi:hypothetical protein